MRTKFIQPVSESECKAAGGGVGGGTARSHKQELFCSHVHVTSTNVKGLVLDYMSPPLPPHSFFQTGGRQRLQHKVSRPQATAENALVLPQ